MALGVHTERSVAVAHAHGPGAADLRYLEDADVQEVLDSVSLDEIAVAWVCFHQRPHAYEDDWSEDPDWWAIEFWQSKVWYADEPVVRDGLLCLLRHASTDVLGDIGAGPFEDYIGGADEDRLQWFETQAARSADFRQALGTVRISNEPTEVFDRLQRAAGTRLAVPPVASGHTSGFDDDD